jgi:hypothetical protein
MCVKLMFATSIPQYITFNDCFFAVRSSSNLNFMSRRANTRFGSMPSPSHAILGLSESSCELKREKCTSFQCFHCV